MFNLKIRSFVFCFVLFSRDNWGKERKKERKKERRKAKRKCIINLSRWDLE